MPAEGSKDDEIGPWLHSWRAREDLTQAELAEKLGYSMSYLAKIEGGSRPPSRAFLARLSQLTNLPGKAAGRASVADITRPALPQPADVLIGRQQSLDNLLGLLRGPARCVTLVGPPGIGKTRLAIEVANRLDLELANGAWWVPLVDVSIAEGVGARMLRALEISEDDKTDPVDLLLGRMRNHRALLVFDNFEHVMDARGTVSRIIANSAHLKILVTSREALDLRSEYRVPVTPLVVADPASGPPLEEVQSNSAVALFVASAQMVDPHFNLTQENYGSVLRACARLDGVPLAIVLAARAIRTIDPAGLANQMAQPLDVLYGAPTDMPPHQESLVAAIAWSWDRLQAEEQDFFETLAVFSGSFSASAASAIGQADLPHTTALLATLSRKSLVEARPDCLSGPRFAMLGVIKAFAIRRLGSSGHQDTVQRRHAAYFAASIENLSRDLVGPAQVQAAHAFADEYENLQLAFDWALDHDPPQAVQIAASAWRFFFISEIPTGRRWLDLALEKSPKPSPARARALAAAGALGWVTGHPDLAARRLDEADDLAQSLGLADVILLILVNRGALAEQQGRLDEALGHFTRALLLAEEAGDQRGEAVALIGLGMIKRRRGDVDGAWPLWTRAAAICQTIGDGSNKSIALGNKAWAEEVSGRLDEAEAISEECRRLQVRIGDARGLAATTAALGRIAFRRQSYERARELQIDALKGFERLGDLPWLGSTLLALAAIEERAGRQGRAAILLGAASTLREENGLPLREEEQQLLDETVSRLRSALAASQYFRATTDGRAMTVSEVVAWAISHPPK